MTAITASSPDFVSMRHAMVASQLRTTAVDDARVVAAMARVPRERFVPSEGAALAYRDTAVALGAGRFANLPMATGRLLNAAMLRAEDRVLLIGAATGYTAAVLAELVAEVVAVESDSALVATARAAVGDIGSVTIVQGVLSEGSAASAPYDVLIVDGAIQALPEALVAQLRVGGRIATGLVDRGVTRLASGRRSASGFGLTDFADADCVVLPGFAAPRRFQF